MKIIVCGGRTYDNRKVVFDTLDQLHAKIPITLLVHGGAKGADKLGMEWACERSVPVKAFIANWNEHGRAAGPIRNGEMLKEMPDLVVAFPGGNDTANMMQQAKAAGVSVVDVCEVLKAAFIAEQS